MTQPIAPSISEALRMELDSLYDSTEDPIAKALCIGFMLIHSDLRGAASNSPAEWEHLFHMLRGDE